MLNFKNFKAVNGLTINSPGSRFSWKPGGSQGSPSAQDRPGPWRYKIILSGLMGRFKIFNLIEKKKKEGWAEGGD